MRRPLCNALLFVGLVFAAVIRVQADGPTATVVASGLNTPWGITTYNNLIYVSESGAGQVVSLSSVSPDKPPIVIVSGFPTRPFHGKYQLGPLGLAFLDKDNFLIAGADAGPGADVIRVFALPPADKVLKPEDAKSKLGPIAKGDQSKTGEGPFFAVAATPAAVYTVGKGDPDQGWLCKSEVSAEKKMADLKPMVATRKESGAAGPFALTVSKSGLLLVGSAGEFGKPNDSTLTFYHSRSPKKLMHLKTDLNDLVDLSYSPKTGRLYALDFSAGDPQHAGVYRIDDAGNESVKTLKIIELDRPTSCAFLADGTLYVTILGALPGTDKPGQVVKIVGL